MEQKLKLELIRKLLKKEGEEGFSLLELVVVVVVLAILSAIGLPYLLSFIDQAIFQATKTSLNQSYTTCRQKPDQAPTGSPIPGVVFQQSNCASEISATINSQCTLSMNMSTGVRTGWSDSYSACVSNSGGDASGDLIASNASVDTSNEVAAPCKLKEETQGKNAEQIEAKLETLQKELGVQYTSGLGPNSYSESNRTDYWNELGFSEGSCNPTWDVANRGPKGHKGCRGEKARQAVDALIYQRPLFQDKERHFTHAEKEIKSHLDNKYMREDGIRGGIQICRDNQGLRINCAGKADFDENKLKELAMKHHLEKEELTKTMKEDTSKNVINQLCAVEVARAKRRQELMDKGLSIPKQDIGRTDVCRSNWMGWQSPCPGSSEEKIHQERMKNDLQYQAEKKKLEELRDQDNYDADAYGQEQMDRSRWSGGRIRQKYENDMKELFKKQQMELDEIRLDQNICHNFRGELVKRDNFEPGYAAKWFGGSCAEK